MISTIIFRYLILKRFYCPSLSRSSNRIYKLLYIKLTTDCSTMTKETRNADNLGCSVWRILLRFVSFMPIESGGGVSLFVPNSEAAVGPGLQIIHADLIYGLGSQSDWGSYHAALLRSVAPTCLRNLLRPSLNTWCGRNVMRMATLCTNRQCCCLPPSHGS